MKNTIITILATLVICLVGYLVYDKFISNDNEVNNQENNNVNNEQNSIKEVSINDPTITSLKYPKDTFYAIGYRKDWQYKNITIDTLGRSKMKYNAAYGLQSVSDVNNGVLHGKAYSAQQIQNNFRQIFGPDTTYYNGDVEEVESCQISKYDATNNTYIAYSGCGGASLGAIDRISRTYKAEQDDNYIYVYQYVQSIWEGSKDSNNPDNGTAIYLLDHNDQKLRTIDYNNYENTIYQMMDKGEVDTYKWTFKKHSDGKYYFYSGAWEN